MVKKFLTLAGICAFAISCFAVGGKEASASGGALGMQSKTGLDKAGLTVEDALVLGLVEGITEFLPISSTGHLIIANAFLGLDSEQPLCDSGGNPVKDADGREYTMKMAADAYAVIIQFGAILAVVLLYWKSVLSMLMGIVGRDPSGFRLFINIVVAFLPAAIIGLLAHDFIEEALFGVKPVIFALAAGALLMFAVQKRYDKLSSKDDDSAPKMEDLKPAQALLIGALQCVAMWPGTSRSMMTILGGYIVGLRPADAAKFSFLLGLVTLGAAGAFKAYKDGDSILRTLEIGPLALGLLVAFASAIVSVRWLVGFLTKRGLIPFAWYRLVLAALLWLMMLSGIAE